MAESLTVAPTGDPQAFRAADGRLLRPPADWVFLPAGDPGLTRRVKAAGPTWTVVVRRGRRSFAQGVWAPAATVAEHRAALEAERATPQHAKKREADARRRERAQAAYVDEFRAEVLAYLAFAPVYADLAGKVAEAVTAHATPVGSGTVARTKRLAVEDRAEAAVIAWMRHQTTAYDQMTIPRVKGMRRQVRRQLAQVAVRLLDAHRRAEAHPVAGCALCRALAAAPEPASDLHAGKAEPSGPGRRAAVAREQDQLYHALWERAEAYGISVAEAALGKDQAGKFDGPSVTINTDNPAAERAFFLAHSVGSIVRWSLAPEAARKVYAELRQAKRHRDEEAERFARALEGFSAFEETASEHAVWLLADLRQPEAVAPYTAFARADLDAMLVFHRTGEAPRWPEFFARWKERAAGGGQEVRPYQPQPIPPFQPVTIPPQEIVQRKD